MTPTGEHIDYKNKKGRRLSFSDESGEKLVETAFSDKLHYSNNASSSTMQNFGGGGGGGTSTDSGSRGCCNVS